MKAKSWGQIFTTWHMDNYTPIDLCLQDVKNYCIVMKEKYAPQWNFDFAVRARNTNNNSQIVKKWLIRQNIKKL